MPTTSAKKSVARTLMCMGLVTLATTGQFALAAPMVYAGARGDAYAANNDGGSEGWASIEQRVAGATSAAIAIAPKDGTLSHGTASADLSQGTIHLFSASLGSDPTIVAAAVITSASLAESFRFIDADGDKHVFVQGEVVTFRVDMRGNSLFTELNPSHGGHTQLDLLFEMWPDQLAGSSCLIQGTEHNNNQSTGGGAALPKCRGSFSLTDSSSGDPYSFANEFEIVIDDVALLNAFDRLDWRLTMKANTFTNLDNHDAMVDASHTATLRAQGPAGTVFTSATGLFPGSFVNPSPVPAPGSLSLALLALGYFVCSPWRQRARVVCASEVHACSARRV